MRWNWQIRQVEMLRSANLNFRGDLEIILSLITLRLDLMLMPTKQEETVLIDLIEWPIFQKLSK